MFVWIRLLVSVVLWWLLLMLLFLLFLLLLAFFVALLALDRVLVLVRVLVFCCSIACHCDCCHVVIACCRVSEMGRRPAGASVGLLRGSGPDVLEWTWEQLWAYRAHRVRCVQEESYCVHLRCFFSLHLTVMVGV